MAATKPQERIQIITKAREKQEKENVITEKRLQQKQHPQAARGLVKPHIHKNRYSHGTESLE